MAPDSNTVKTTLSQEIESHIHNLLTISPDFGIRPCHFGIACARSTYAAFVPVPRITAAITS